MDNELKPLLPCPFCGLSNNSGNGIDCLRFNDPDDGRNGNHIVKCWNCGASTSHFEHKTAQEAINAWNTRKEEQ